MKKLLILIILCTLYSVLCTPIALAWQIDSYDTSIAVQDDSTLLITEVIEANFSQDPHHGIYRNIPRQIANENGNLEKLRLNIISITDENGTPLNYTTTQSFSATTLQIGDEDILIQALQTYVITYEVLNGLSFFDDHDEVYWDAVGIEWEAEILEATATVILPDGIQSIQDIQTICYAGTQGSSSQNCSAHVSSLQTVEFYTKDLNWYEGFTIAVGFPKDLVTEPSRTLWILMDFWPIVIIPIVFTFLFRRWKRYGKDKKIHTVVPEYAPPKEISPIESGILIDEKADMRDISAVMIDLAIRGFIRIEEIEEKTLGIFKHKEYILHRLKESGEKNLQKFEQTLLDKIFDGKKEQKLSKLKNKFYKHIPELKKQMFTAVMDKKLFTKNPEKAKTWYIVIGMFVTFGGFAAIPGLAFYMTWGIVLGLSLAICGILTIVFGFYMPQKTDHGHELYKRILGLKMYIETAEKDRIKFHEKEKHFEKLLPYAMIFSQTKHWAKQFEDIYTQPPDWYTASTWGAASAFSLTDFTHNLENCTSAISTSLASSPGSGGSGFGGGGGAGGGGGGGGGGAW